MFGFNLSELNMTTVIIILVCVGIALYVINRSSNYSASLVEGLINKNDKDMQNMKVENLKEYLMNLEKSNSNFTKSDKTKIDDLVQGLMGDLKLGETIDGENNTYRDYYEDILIDLEKLCDIMMLSQCLQLSSQITKKKSSYMDVVGTATIVNQLQTFKENLTNVHKWTTNQPSV